VTTNEDLIFKTAEELAVQAVDDPGLVDEYQQATREAQECEGSRGWKYRTSNMRQVDKIINHIKKQGSITQREAFIDYGVQSFHRRLSDIKEMGYKITGKQRFHPVTNQPYTRYYLNER